MQVEWESIWTPLQRDSANSSQGSMLVQEMHLAGDTAPRLLQGSLVHEPCPQPPKRHGHCVCILLGGVQMRKRRS